MELFSAALPNVMFVVGIVAISIGLGIELKLVPVTNQVGRSGRIGAITVGILLVIVSIFLYIRPDGATATSVPTTPVVAAPTALPANVTPEGQPISASAIPSSSIVPVVEPTHASVAQPVSDGQATTVPRGVSVPDLTGQKLKDAQGTLSTSGLVLGVAKESCSVLGAGASSGAKGPKDRILCQRPAPGSIVAPGTPIDYVLTGDQKK